MIFVQNCQGILPPLLGRSLLGTVMFGTYGTVRSHFIVEQNEEYIAGDGTGLPLHKTMAAGGAAGLSVAFLATPVDQLKIALQTQTQSACDPQSANGTPRPRYTSTLGCCQHLIQTHGLLKGFYCQLLPTICECLCLSVYFAAYETGKRHLSSSSYLPLSLVHVISGSISGVVMVCVSLPFDTVKTRLMYAHAHTNTSKHPPYNNPMECLRATVRSEGVAGLYRGLQPACLRAAFANGVSFVVFEGVLSCMQIK